MVASASFSVSAGSSDFVTTTLAHPSLSNRILLVEDHVRLAGLVERGLSASGFAVDVCHAMETAWLALASQPYAAAIVDRGLPDGDGLGLVRRMRAANLAVPCLMLTARDALRDRVDGLDAGADDYLVKPFELDELAARVRALMRRAPEVRENTPRFHALEVCPEDACMRSDEGMVTLAPGEMQIMLCLVRAGGRTVRRAVLESAAWGVNDAVTPNALDVALHRLRKKLAAIDSQLAIVNARNHGYALQVSDDAA